MEWRPGGGVFASVSLPLHHKVQKFSSGTVSPGWSRKKGRKTVMVWWLFQSTTFNDRDEIWRTSGTTVKLWYGMLFRVQNIMSLIWVLLPPTPSLQDNIWNATLWCTLSCEISGWLHILSPLRAKIANFTKIWIMGAHIYSPPHHRSVPVKFGVWERTHDVFFHTKFLIEQCIVSHLSDDKKQIQPHLQFNFLHSVMTPPSGAGTKLNEGVKLQTFAYRNECLMVIPLAQTLHTFKSVTDKKNN